MLPFLWNCKSSLESITRMPWNIAAQWWIQGRGPFLPVSPPPRIFRPDWGPKSPKNFFWRLGPFYLRIWMTPPPPSLIWRSGSSTAACFFIANPCFSQIVVVGSLFKAGNKLPFELDGSMQTLPPCFNCNFQKWCKVTEVVSVGFICLRREKSWRKNLWKMCSLTISYNIPPPLSPSLDALHETRS